MRPVWSSLVLVLAVGFGCAQPSVRESANPDSGAPPPPSPPVAENVPEPEASANSEPQMLTQDELMAFAVYTPNPDVNLLQQTKAARFDKSDGHSTVHFCVEPNGETSDIRTVEEFPGDPLVDQILRDTIAKWRFKPADAGFSDKVCSHRKFKLRFKGPEPVEGSERAAAGD